MSRKQMLAASPANSFKNFSKPLRAHRTPRPNNQRKFLVAGALIACDAISIALVLSVITILAPNAGFGRSHQVWLALLAPFFGFAVLGLYSGSGPSPYERFGRRMMVVAILAACVFVSMMENAFPAWTAFVGTMSMAILFFTAGHYCECAARAGLIRAGLWGAPTIVVGEEPDTSQLVAMLIRHPEIGLAPISPARVESFSRSISLRLTEEWDGAEVMLFTSRSALGAYAATAASDATRRLLLLAEPEIAGQTLWVHSRSLGGARAVELRRGLHSKPLRLLKRMVDLAIGVPAALMAAPLIGALALAVILIDGGPVFYAQERVGLDGKTLRMLKLRTMRRDAIARLERLLAENPIARDEWNRYFKLRRDPRILPFIGAFMRKASLDELPQLWHVITGEMSLVGPRPFPSYHMNRFDPEFRSLRVQAQPGLSGLWQVLSRSDGDLQVQREQDLFYIDNWSPLLDLFIIFQTLPAVLTWKGAR